MVGYTTRALQPNDQLHISYDTNISFDENTKRRQKKLRGEWGFTCNCEKCASRQRITVANKEVARRMQILLLEETIQNHGSDLWTPQYGAYVDEYSKRITAIS